jgi:hypothetical protein
MARLFGPRPGFLGPRLLPLQLAGALLDQAGQLLEVAPPLADDEDADRRPHGEERKAQDLRVPGEDAKAGIRERDTGDLAAVHQPDDEARILQQGGEPGQDGPAHVLAHAGERQGQEVGGEVHTAEHPLRPPGEGRGQMTPGHHGDVQDRGEAAQPGGGRRPARDAPDREPHEQGERRAQDGHPGFDGVEPQRPHGQEEEHAAEPEPDLGGKQLPLPADPGRGGIGRRPDAEEFRKPHAHLGIAPPVLFFLRSIEGSRSRWSRTGPSPLPPLQRKDLCYSGPTPCRGPA